MSLVHNERTKLSALNNTSVATIVTGLVAPVVGFLYGAAPLNGWWWLIAGAWFAAGLVLHLLARAILGRLKQ